jgi:glycosyltransferase involved in cell wall biosynthesis
MRILQIFNRYEQFGGEEAAVREIEEALREKHTVTTFYGSTREMMGTGLTGKLLAPIKAVWNRRAFVQVSELQSKEHFDVWIVHNVFPGLSPAVYDAAKRCGVPVVQYLHNYRFACINGFLLNHGEPCQRCLNGNFIPAVQTKCWQESRLACATMGISLTRLRTVGVFNQVSHWIAISHAQKAIHTKIGIPAEKISVIYHFFNGVYSEGPPDRRDVLFIGRISPEKGVGLLLDAWLKLPATDRRLWIVGDGPLRQELERRALGRADIVFTGFLQGADLEAVWQKAVISVVPSIWEEAFGRVLIESWAHGVPVLAARIGALPELIEATGAGWLFEPRNADDLGAQLNLISSDRPSLQKVASRCAAAVARFNRQAWLREIEAVLDSTGIPHPTES